MIEFRIDDRPFIIAMFVQSPLCFVGCGIAGAAGAVGIAVAAGAVAAALAVASLLVA